MNRLEQKVVIVTGSCNGIGRAIAKRCVDEGARVVIHGLEEELSPQLVAELGEERAVALVEDLTTDGCVERLVGIAFERYGRLDAVVNNAAIVVVSDLHSTGLAFYGRKKLQRLQFIG